MKVLNKDWRVGYDKVWRGGVVMTGIKKEGADGRNHQLGAVMAIDHLIMRMLGCGRALGMQVWGMNIKTTLTINTP